MKVFGFVLARKAEHSIKLMCRVLEVSRSGYHAWAARELSPRAVADAVLSGRIAAIHKRSLLTYGSPRVHAELHLEHDIDALDIVRSVTLRSLRRETGQSPRSRRARDHDE